MKKRSYTKTALIYLLIPIFHVAVFLVFLLLSSLAELPTERSGIYLFFAALSIFFMLAFPAVQIGCSIGSVVNQRKALGNNESKAKNIVMLVVSILYIVVAIVYSHQLWLGIMSV